MDYKEEYKTLLEIVRQKRKKAKAPARNEDLAAMLGYNRSYFSTLIGPKGNVTPEHLKILLLTHPWLKKHTEFRFEDIELENVTRGTLENMTLEEPVLSWTAAKDKQEIISLLKEKNERLQNALDVSLIELSKDITAISGMQKAVMEILLLLASQNKSVYNKSVEVLRKHGLEGIFL